MGLEPQRKDSKTFGTTVYGLTHPNSIPKICTIRHIATIPISRIYLCIMYAALINRMLHQAGIYLVLTTASLHFALCG